MSTKKTSIPDYSFKDALLRSREDLQFATWDSYHCRSFESSLREFVQTICDKEEGLVWYNVLQSIYICRLPDDLMALVAYFSTHKAYRAHLTNDDQLEAFQEFNLAKVRQDPQKKRRIIMENMNNQNHKAGQVPQPTRTDGTTCACTLGNLDQWIEPVMDEFAGKVAATLKKTNRDIAEVKRYIAGKTTLNHNNSSSPPMTILTLVMEGVLSIGVVYYGQLVTFNQRELANPTAEESSSRVNSPVGAKSSFSALNPKPSEPASNMAIYLDLGPRQKQGW